MARLEAQRADVTLAVRGEARIRSATLASISMPVFSQTIRGIGIGRQSANSMRMK